VVSAELKNAMNLSSGTYQLEVDEFELTGLTKSPGKVIAAPHVAESPAVLECRLVNIVDDLPTWREHACNIVVIGEVVGVHIREECIVEGRLDVLTFNPVARLGYMDYTTVTNVWEMLRPD
jgi:flavin reductase (DIM6/NTAB) family NADH-FMN oxidoreductase RutF